MSTIVKSKREAGFPFPKKDPEERKRNFSEVQIPYTERQAVVEAERCLQCGTPVCIDACPVQMDVRGMCEAVSRHDFETAFRRIRDTNALLGVTARCCPQLSGLCEDACVLRWEGEPVAIGMIQRFMADWERNNSKQPNLPGYPKTGKRVAVVGSGPAGLAAAELLARYGHDITIYEELPVPGGTPWYAIPDYHLPKDVLTYEIEKIKTQGVNIKTGVKVGEDVTLTQLLSEEADAVLICTGAKDVTQLDTPGRNLAGVIDGYQFLEDVFVDGLEQYMKNPKHDLGKDVLVIGAGDSALDAARTALRLTQGNVTIVYRRTEKEMPADPIMLEEAKEEGVQFKFLADPKSFNGKNGKISDVTMYTMQLGPPDQTGRRSPVPVEGKDFTMKADSVLITIGRGPNSFVQIKEGMKTSKRNAIAVDDHFRTSMTGVFAAGDVTRGETLIVRAMGSGREAAQRVHEYLMNLEDKHISLYEMYFTRRSWELMQMGEDEERLPPP
jgi:glutamate synthase (NADPH/NADH) small chain